MIHIRVDDDLKEQAAETLALMGLSVSDAVRVFLKRVIAEQALPFDLRVPNQATRTAIAEAKEIAARRARFATAEDLISKLENDGER